MGDKPPKRYSRLLTLLLFGPFALMLLAPLAVMFLHTRLPEPRPLDPATAIVFSKWLDEQMLERYGPPAPVESKTALRQLLAQSTFTSDLRVERLHSIDHYAPMLDSDLDALQRNHTQTFGQIDTLLQAGPIYPTYESLVTASGNSGKWSDLYAVDRGQSRDWYKLNWCSLLHAYFAQKAAGEADWPEVMAQLEMMARAGDGLSYAAVWHAFSLRQRVYKTAELLLGDAVPLDVKRQAAEWLRDIRERDPRLNAYTFFQNSRMELFGALSYYDYPNAPDVPEFQNSSMERKGTLLAMFNPEFDDPDRRSFASALQKRANGEDPLGDFGFSGGIDPRLMYDFFSGCALHESFVRDWPLMNEEFWGPDADPVTKLFVGVVASNSDFQFMRSAYDQSMRGYLLEAALAAQIHHAETGRWPESPGELALGPVPRWTFDHDFMVADYENRRFVRASDQYDNMARNQQLNMGWIEPDDEAVATLRAARLPMAHLDRSFRLIPAYRTPDGLIVRVGRRIDGAPVSTETPRAVEVYSLGYWPNMSSDDLLRSIAAIQAFAAHSDLVESASAYWLLGAELPPNPDEESLRNQIMALYAKGEFEAAAELEEMLYSDQYPRSTPAPTTTGVVLYREADAAEARELIDAADVWRWTTGNSTPLPPDQSHIVPDPAAPEPQMPQNLLLEIEFTTPTRIFAVWLNGPDGDDDGGRIAYNPANGTLSNGDLIQFVDYSQ